MQDWGQQLFVYPATDEAFKSAVENSLLEIGRRRVQDLAVVAAAEALIRTSYPLAKLQPHANHRDEEWNAWDAFRDEAVLDAELVQRAQAGSETATGQLFDRHHRLAYAVAALTVGPSDDAMRAVNEGFRTVLLVQPQDGPVRISLATAVRDAALRLSGSTADRGDDQGRLQRSVLQLAHDYKLSGNEIAAVLRVDIREVRLLATAGLRSILDAKAAERQSAEPSA